MMMMGSLIPFSVTWIEFRKRNADMPLAATSAACHRPPNNANASVSPIQWGVVSMSNGIGHYSFGSKFVEASDAGSDIQGLRENPLKP